MQQNARFFTLIDEGDYLNLRRKDMYGQKRGHKARSTK